MRVIAIELVSKNFPQDKLHFRLAGSSLCKITVVCSNNGDDFFLAIAVDGDAELGECFAIDNVTLSPRC
ncbi:hypothetical protein D3C81_2264120 [compost metagenome]